MSGNNYNLQFCSHFISLLLSLSLWIAEIVYVYFVYFIHVTSTVLLLLSQTKAHTHTTQVKAPYTRAVLLCTASECSPFLLKDASLFPSSPPPLSHERCMFLLPYMDLNVGSWCKVYTTPLKSIQGIWHMHALGRQRFGTQWSLPCCVFTCELPQNPILQPTSIPCKTAPVPHPDEMLQNPRRSASPGTRSILWFWLLLSPYFFNCV